MRMNLAVVITAGRYGATVANYVSAIGLKKNVKCNKEIICGVDVRDQLTGEEWTVRTKCVINATGPFTDSIRLMDDPKASLICTPASGIHVVLPGI